MWRISNGGAEIYHEKEKWIIGGRANGPNGPNEKYFISDSSPECPESVESWSNQINGLKLEDGKIECDSVIYSLDKLKPKPNPKNKN